MKYSNITEGEFISRPNRFIANVRVGDNVETVHVKNTGRCKELLLPSSQVYLWKSENESRKTKYDLVCVKKGDRLINIDSMAPNAVALEYISEGRLVDNLRRVQSEYTYNSSRFDFYIETDTTRAFVEVKGVTLERDGVVLFPDAPTERGVKHVKELITAKQNGFDAYIFFVVQMSGVKEFTPNTMTHPEFSDALKTAMENGVHIVAITCNVTPDEIIPDKIIPVIL